MPDTNACIEAIKNQALADADVAKYCRNCKLSYFRPNEEWGYCKLHIEGKPVIPPPVVNEFFSCCSWERKKE